MLKETETEKRVGFFVTFLLLVVFQLGGWGRPPHQATPVIITLLPVTFCISCNRTRKPLIITSVLLCIPFAS